MKETRILFVGNSYTQFNNLPQLVSAMLATSGRKVLVGQYLYGGTSLKQHWNHNLGVLEEPEKKDPNAAKKLLARKGQFDALLNRKGSWDCVILQGHSRDALIKEFEFPKYARLFAEKVRQADPNIKVMFYLTWARQNLPDDQAAITKAYVEAAKENKALAAPVGEAWKAAFAARQELVLHTPDKSHPDIMGSYLAGCVFYACITGRSPVGLPGRLPAPGTDERQGKGLCDLKAEDARFLQEVAWRTVQRFQEERSAAPSAGGSPASRARAKEPDGRT